MDGRNRLPSFYLAGPARNGRHKQHFVAVLKRIGVSPQKADILLVHIHI